jgi:hypothetical protein
MRGRVAASFCVVFLLSLFVAGCASPPVLVGTVDRPAVRNLWFSHDDRWLLIRTDREFVLADMSVLSAAVVGAAGGPDTDVWVSPVSNQFVEVDAAAGRARMLHALNSAALPGTAWLTHRTLEDWFIKGMPGPRRPQGTWTDWFVLGDATAPAPAAGEPIIPAGGSVLPADPLKFWIAFAAGRTIKDDDRDRVPAEAEIRAAFDSYSAGRAGFRMIHWSQPGRPRAPVELDSPRKRWRVHLRPTWGLIEYGVDVVREDLRTGKKHVLIRSGGG